MALLASFLTSTYQVLILAIFQHQQHNHLDLWLHKTLFSQVIFFCKLSLESFHCNPGSLHHFFFTNHFKWYFRSLQSCPEAFSTENYAQNFQKNPCSLLLRPVCGENGEHIFPPSTKISLPKDFYKAYNSKMCRSCQLLCVGSLCTWTMKALLSVFILITRIFLFLSFSPLKALSFIFEILRYIAFGENLEFEERILSIEFSMLKGSKAGSRKWMADSFAKICNVVNFFLLLLKLLWDYNVSFMEILDFSRLHFISFSMSTSWIMGFWGLIRVKFMNYDNVKA